MAQAKPNQSVQVFGRKKNAVAVAFCKAGKGQVRVNGAPIELVEPAPLRLKVMEPFYLLKPEHWQKVDIRVRVKGGGYTAQVYAIRQALCKALVSFNQKFVDETTKQSIKSTFLRYDRTLLVADPRRPEPKKFGGPSARTRYQKSYR